MQSKLDSIVERAKNPFLWTIRNNQSEQTVFYSDLAEITNVRNADKTLPYLSIPKQIYLLKKPVKKLEEINRKNTSLFPSAYRVVYPSYTEVFITHANNENKPEVYVARVEKSDTITKRAIVQEIFAILRLENVFVRDFIEGLVQVKSYSKSYLT